jgi:hypothetical protein
MLLPPGLLALGIAVPDRLACATSEQLLSFRSARIASRHHVRRLVKFLIENLIRFDRNARWWIAHAFEGIRDIRAVSAGAYRELG